jgi:hypothetical protein
VVDPGVLGCAHTCRGPSGRRDVAGVRRHAAYDAHCATQGHKRPEDIGKKLGEEKPADAKPDQAYAECAGERTRFIRGASLVARSLICWHTEIPQTGDDNGDEQREAGNSQFDQRLQERVVWCAILTTREKAIDGSE